MNRRVLLFFLLSFAIIQLTVWWSTPPVKDPRLAQPAAKAEADAANEEAEGEAADDAPAGEDGEAGADENADEDAAAGDPAQPEEDVPTQLVTLGSVDETTGYRMGVTFTNKGAAVVRAELANSRYLDLHDFSGYLGHLEVAADGGTGLLVQSVVDGTPAAVAGMKVGDRLLEAGRDKTTPLAKPGDLGKMLAASKPRQKFSLVIERDGARQTLTATLARRPLEVIRPEAENVLMRTGKLPAGFNAPPSFLFTLQSVDDQEIKKYVDDEGVEREAESLPGVDLHKANWRIVPAEGGDQAGDTVTFERRVPKFGLVVTKRYKLSKATTPVPDDAAAEEPAADPPAAAKELPAYDLTLEVSIRNEGEDVARKVAYRLDGPNGLPIEGWWYATKIGRSWGAAGIRDVISRYFLGVPDQQGAATIAAGDVEDVEGSAMAYVGVDAQYFCVALLPKIASPEEGWIPRVRSIVAGTPPNLLRKEGNYANVSFRLFTEPTAIEPGESATHAYTLFAGPKRPDLLAEYYAAKSPAYSLNDFVYYGWFGAVARAMVGLLHLFYSFVGNYGIAIIMLTVLVRGCMFPISRGQARSMAKLQLLRPEMDRIKEKYQGDQQKQAQAMQQLYRKHNVNPLAGCLPMLIQLPVFIGLYRGLAVDVELRGSPLFSESIHWCSNLAAPDMFYDWSWFMPELITRGEGFFGLGPYLNVLPLVTIVLFLVQQKMFMPPPESEQAALQQKIMKYMMVFMGILFYKVPSGLCLYFIASSLWGIVERKMIPPPTPIDPLAAGADLPPTKPRQSGGTLPEKRSGKNGAKPKRRK